MTKRQMHLGAMFGFNRTSRRHPEAADENIFRFKYFKQLAQIAERGKLDMIFLADVLALSESRSADFPSPIQHMITFRPEPLNVLSALSAVTERIGLAGTVSTTYSHPFHVARQFASLDHLSDGRAAWNVVTSASGLEAKNFGLDGSPQHEFRYERAGEFVEVVKKLWDSWEDDAILLDKAGGNYADPRKVHEISHQGKWFSVRGPLTIPRPPQGHPVIIQAGASETGKDFAASTAEVVFVAAQTLEDSFAYYSDLKQRAAAFGRSPDDMKVLPGVQVIVGQTEREAQEKRQYLESIVIPELGFGFLAELVDFDFSEYPLDGPFPDIPLDQINGIKSRYNLLKAMAEREQLTLKQVLQRMVSTAGHRVLAGTPNQIADDLQSWFLQRAADGFIIQSPLFPGSLEDFVNRVVPELQNRGIFRSEYTGSTLREHLGLQRP